MKIRTTKLIQLAGAILAVGTISHTAIAAPIVTVAGSDGWITPNAGTTEYDFSLDPIPADFFGPGSDPFQDAVTFVGAPLETTPPGELGLIDTIIRRVNDTAALDVGQSDTIDIEIVALSLVSAAPITVTYNGGFTPEDWTIRVCLSSAGQTPGSMTITRSTNDGGTFTSTFSISLRFIFDGPVGPLIWDCGGGACGDLVMGGEDVNWVLIDGPGGITRAQLGVSEFGAVQVNSDCDVLGTPDVTTLGVSNFQGGFADTGDGEGECIINEEAERALAEQRGSHDSFGPTEQDTDGNGVPDECEGACCLPSGSCEIKIEKDCGAAGGDYLGNKSQCQGDGDGNGIDDACEDAGPRCGNGALDPGEQCDGTDDLLCPDQCRPPGHLQECTCPPVCGNGIIEKGEQCDGDAGTCPGKCVDCQCVGDVPTLPHWGLVGLGLLLAAGGAVVFIRRRAAA